MDFTKVQRAEEYCDVCGSGYSNISGCDIDFIKVEDGTDSTFICEDCAEGISIAVRK